MINTIPRFCGGAAGWFGAKMLLKRTTRVFQLRSWVGLGILTAMVAVSLVASRFDVLGIEDRIPDVEDVSSVTLNFDGLELTSEEDIRRITTLHAMALEDRIESYGDYPLAYILHREEKEKHPVMPEGGFVYGEGGYTGEPSEVLLSVISNRELPRLEKLVHSIDPACFLIVSRVTEVSGRGFSMEKEYQ